LPSKLLKAQTELQKCEARLLAKELELSKLCYALLKDGLRARMRVLLDCALVFGQLGREELVLLNMLDADLSFFNTPNTVHAVSSTTL